MTDLCKIIRGNIRTLKAFLNLDTQKYEASTEWSAFNVSQSDHMAAAQKSIWTGGRYWIEGEGLGRAGVGVGLGRAG